MGRIPAENAGGAEVYWEGIVHKHRSRFQQLPWSAETVYLKNPLKKLESKTPPRPCGSLSGSGWESLPGNAHWPIRTTLGARAQKRTRTQRSGHTFTYTRDAASTSRSTRGCRCSVRSVEIEIEIEIEIDPCSGMASGPHGPLQPPAGLCRHRNNTVALPGLSGLNPIPASIRYRDR